MRGFGVKIQCSAHSRHIHDMLPASVVSRQRGQTCRCGWARTLPSANNALCCRSLFALQHLCVVTVSLKCNTCNPKTRGKPRKRHAPSRQREVPHDEKRTRCCLCNTLKPQIAQRETAAEKPHTHTATCEQQLRASERVAHGDGGRQ